MPQHEITLRFLAEPTAVNFGGKVHGGAVMKWIDEAGYAIPAWEPRDDADIALQDYAKNMMTLGKEMEQNAIPFGGIASGAQS